MLWLIAGIFSLPALILAIAIGIWLKRGRPPMGDPDRPQSIDGEIARSNLWGHPGPL